MKDKIYLSCEVNKASQMMNFKYGNQDRDTLRQVINEKKTQMDELRVLQYLFFKQWKKLKNLSIRRRMLHILQIIVNLAVFQINAFNSANHWQVAGLGSYPKIDYFTPNDFQYGKEFKVGKSINGDISLTLGKRLKHESCNLLHRHFEELQGSAWKLSEYYKKADFKTRYAIRQLNNLCLSLIHI